MAGAWTRFTIIVSAGISLVGCAGDAATQSGDQDYSLQLVQIYGDSTAPDSAKKFGHGMLARISDVVDDSAGNVYVLDSEYKKIAVFGRGGEFKRNIVGGRGAGPGEFKLPIALDVHDGAVYVYDHALGRISVFDTAGNFKRVISALNAPYKDIAVRNDTIFATPLPATKWGLDILAATGELIERKIPLTARDSQFSKDGLALFLAHGVDGDILVGHMRAGLWFSAAGQWGMRGQELLPDARAMQNGDENEPPTQIYGLAPITDDRVAIGYSTIRPAPDSGKARFIFEGVIVGVFDRRGKHIGNVKMAETWISTFSGSVSNRTSILVGESEPYPHVRRMVIDHAKQ
jgi:hypothetical protein